MDARGPGLPRLSGQNRATASLRVSGRRSVPLRGRRRPWPGACSARSVSLRDGCVQQPLRAPVIELQPGERLRIRSLDCLPPLPPGLKAHQHGDALPQDGPVREAGQDCRNAGAPAVAGGAPLNLHTHGAIVSARNDLRRPPDADRPGDNVYVANAPGLRVHYVIDVPASLPRSVLLERGGGAGQAIAHPTGLFWYHPHLHGISGWEVTSGMAGTLAIGDPFSLMLPVGGPMQPWRADRWREEQRTRTDVHYVALRDIQLSGASDLAAARRIDEADPSLCGDWARPGNAASGPWVLPDDADHARFPGGCRNGDNVWLFPLNDKLYPTVEVGEDRDLLARISNQSASVTYRLSIRQGWSPATASAGEVSGRALPFEVVGIDGVVAGTPGGGGDGTGTVTSRTVEEIVLMPASRADILIRNGQRSPDRGVRFELVNRPMDMSGTATADSQGVLRPDAVVWPDMRLASVVLNGSPGPADPALEMLRPVALAKTSAAPVIVPSATPATTGRVSNAGFPGCVDDLALGGGARRIVVFGHDTVGTEEQFKLGYGRAGRGAGPERMLIPPQIFPENINWEGPNPTPHVCIAKGEEEVWELRNTTGEVHNFHLHQAKFRLAFRSEVERVVKPAVASLACGSGAASPDTPCIADPAGNLRRSACHRSFGSRTNLGFFTIPCRYRPHPWTDPLDVFS